MALASVCSVAVDVGAVPSGTGQPASAREREARDHALHGRHDAIVALLEGAKGRSDSEDALYIGALAGLGRLTDARAAYGRCAERPRCAEAAAALELAGGDRKRAVKVAAAALRRNERDIRVRVALGEALYATGKDVAARRLLDPLADLYAAGRVGSIEDQIAIARSLALNGFFKDANAVMADASEAVAEPRERKAVEYAWALLFLTKHNYRDADAALAKVLKLDPHHAGATVAMARIDLDSDHDVARARKRLDALLARNPRCVPALLARAEVAIADEDEAEGLRLVERAAAIAPDHADVLALRAALAALADDARALRKTLQRALAVDPTDGRPHLVAARYLETAHRYDLVREHLQAAIKIDPELWAAHAALGMAYARVVDDDKALRHLNAAYQGDPFDVRTANVLNVLYDGVLRHMVTLPGEHVELRVHRADRLALERNLLPFLQSSYETLRERYAMEAKGPLRVEVFPTVEQFSVRTVGLPRLGAHAVCFGHLITSRSPVESPFNWKMVLHHELAHVFHIQASEGRVPRWLTEGLAMMESAWLDPRYHMIMERALYDRSRDGKLTPVATFNLAFSQARTMDDIVAAYYQSMFYVRFLAETFGFEKLRELVAAHKRGKSTAALIASIYKTTPAALDSQFAGWLARTLARFDRDFRTNPDKIALGLAGPWQSDADKAAVEALEAWHQAYAKRNGRAARRALEALFGDKAGAGAAADKVTATAGARRGHVKPADPAPAAAAAPRQISAPRCAAHYIAMQHALAQQNVDAARDHADALVRAQGGRCDGVEQRVVLARALAQDREARSAAMAHLEAALAIDPRDLSVVMALLEIGKGRLEPTRERALLRQAIVLAPNRPEPAERLARLVWRALAPTLGLDGIATKAAAANTTPNATATATASATASVGAGAGAVDGAGTSAGPGAAKPATAGTASDAAASAPGAAAAATAGATAASPPAQAPLDAKTLAALRDDLQLAAAQLVETTPASRLAALFEARTLVAVGRSHQALPLYRVAADAGHRARQRAEAWCELERVARKVKAKADAKEAARRCGVERAAK